ncbi:MAG: hypothetical protein ACM31L_16845 [Actinomycetota bacterium]
MKVAIGMRPRSGPWGGGNRFVVALVEALHRRGDRVVFDLADGDIDILLLVDPRRKSESASFQDRQIAAYLRRRPQAMVVHRVNECDERKGTVGINRRLRHANLMADRTVFVSAWLMRLHLAQGWPCRRNGTILTGADRSIFNADGFVPWDGNGPLRVVTHHWGANRLKGFDIYERLDAMLAEPEWAGRLQFTYVGNLPQGYRFANATHVGPLDGPSLAAELKRHHVYLTASVNEPSGNHHIEGASCGLPLLYRVSGGITEYCEGFGVPFADEAAFPDALRTMVATYSAQAAKMPAYTRSMDDTVAGYLALFDEMAGRRPSGRLAKSIAWRLGNLIWR